MKILLVEPDCQKLPRYKGKPYDAVLWYPPLALMKLARFHRDRGDEVHFVRGLSKTALGYGPLFLLWDRIYISTLFTFHYDRIIKTIEFYKDAVGGTTSRIYIGGIMASLMPKDIEEATNIRPIEGVINSSQSQLDLLGGPTLDRDINVDELPPLYDIVENKLYAINDTLYAYTTRGCINKCPWCGVPTIEPSFVPYIDIKPSIKILRKEFKDRGLEPSQLKLMDNNVLASEHLDKIVNDLLELGYGKEQYTDTNPKKVRSIDFNQGLSASRLTKEKMALLAKLNIKPMRFAFDHIKEKKAYECALEIAYKHGVSEFSNYMLYNFLDTPKDLYDRLIINIQFNELWAERNCKKAGKIYSYPMRYAPIVNRGEDETSRSRDRISLPKGDSIDWQISPKWTKRFMRNIEIMKGAAHGAISPTPTLAWRTIGKDFSEFIANLYMPEELLRNRNKHEKKVYNKEPNRKRGTGKVELFRTFILTLLEKQDARFQYFHSAVSENSLMSIKSALRNCNDKEIRKWLRLYVNK
jgi:hypothetical protein